MKNLDNFKFSNKKILLRVDLNVPYMDGKITEISRIKIIKKTINKLQENNNKIYLVSHFGRPLGKYKKKYSLEFICLELKKILKLNKVYFLNDFKDKKIDAINNKLKSGDICLIENIRFYPEEEKNDIKFAKKISKNFDIYVNDAFSASHRKHASIVSIPKFLPSYAGYSLTNEIDNINYFIKNPKKPNLAIIGGSKISTKINLLNNLCETFDSIAIGGAMANTFLYANGINIGNSLYEKDLDKIAISILKKAKKFNCKIILPIDVVCGKNLNDKVNIKEINVNNILSNQMILDIGINTTNLISSNILKSKMILWNGPLGAFEYKPFDKSSIKIAKCILKNYGNLNMITLAGGGDTISAIKLAKAEKGFSYISKAGGAFLEWLEGNKSPGIKALEKNIIN